MDLRGVKRYADALEDTATDARSSSVAAHLFMNEPTKQWRCIYVWDDAYFERIHESEEGARNEIKKMVRNYVINPVKPKLEVRECGPWKQVEL